MFAKGFRNRGLPNITTYLKTYRLGDIVDIKANSAVQLGMPHKYYHGKTGRVFNVTPRAVGIVINKRVNTRIIPKRIHVRVEHISHSKCRQDFINRVKKNETLKREARKEKKTLSKGALKRQPKQPARGFLVSVKKTEVQTIRPLAHEDLF